MTDTERTRPTRVALVTGASRGLGATIASFLAATGYALVVDVRGAAALEAAADYVGPGTLVDGVRAAPRGEVVLDPAAMDAEGSAAPSPLAALSAREREVLACIVDGMTNKQAAQALGISEKTVKTHISHLLAKLGVRDRPAAAVLGVGGSGVR